MCSGLANEVRVRVKLLCGHEHERGLFKILRFFRLSLITPLTCCILHTAIRWTICLVLVWVGASEYVFSLDFGTSD